MKALRIDGSGVAVRDVADPEASPGPQGQEMVVVAVRLAGVCNTDLEIAQGYMGFEGTLGHELVGEVVEGPGEWLGTRVTCEINFACERCDRCAAGLGRHCAERRVLGILAADGAFAERVAVPLANLHRVPDALSDETAVFCEPLAAAYEILEQVALESGQRCVVLGDGKLGNLVAQVLANAGGDVTAVGKHPEKLAALEARGLRTIPLERFRSEATAPADLVVDATGSAEGLALAISATRPRGKLVLKSTVAGESTLDLAPIVIDEIEVIGSRCGPFAPALVALEQGAVDVSSLLDERHPLSRATDALAAARRRGARKVLIDPT